MTIFFCGVKYTVPDPIMKGFGEIAMCDPSHYRGRECPPLPTRIETVELCTHRKPTFRVQTNNTNTESRVATTRKESHE